MTYSASLTREELLSWLGQSFAPNAQKGYAKQIGKLGSRIVTLVWADEPLSTSIKGDRPLIAVPRADIREFYSFVGTYVSTFYPFSAFFRVVTAEQIADLLDEYRPQKSIKINSSYLVGPIIAEARVQSGDNVRSLSDLSIQACLATMSASAASILAAGLSRHDLEKGCERWFRTRELLKEDSLPLDFRSIVEFWNTISLIFEETPLLRVAADETLRKVIQFVTEVVSSPTDADPELWGPLTEGLSRSRFILGSMRDSREERVRALDDVTREIATNESVDRRIREVVAGYLASRVAGGSFSYLQLLNPLENQLPLAPLWFGLFSAFRPDSDVMTVAECLGRRISRDIEQPAPLFSNPTADLSIDELEVLLSNGTSPPKLRTEHQSSIAVEIFPTINAVFRLPRESRKGSDPHIPAVPKQLIGELRYLTQRLMRTVEDLDDPRQQRLFSDDQGRSKYPSRPRRGEK